MSNYLVPFNKASIAGPELEFIIQAIKNGHISSNGTFTSKCERALEEIIAARKVLLTTSCTDALEMAALLLNIQPGDEIILPTYTFVSTINAFALRGARPVFADIRPDTLNLNEKLLPGLITPKTKVIVPVHYAGVGCEMSAIVDIASSHQISVVEDNAHGLFGKYRSENLGTFGQMATLSFHETKNLTCGEGGALIVNDEELLERAQVLREKGTDRYAFFRGEVDKYTWVDLGSSFLPSEILAAFLYAQIAAHEQIQEKRKRLWNRYHAELQEWAHRNGVDLPHVPPHCEQPYHMFYLLLPSEEDRTRLIQHLHEKRILSVFHYVPLHLSKMGRQYGGRPGDCPVAEDLSSRILRLPFYTELTDQMQTQVIERVHSFQTYNRLQRNVA